MGKKRRRTGRSHRMRAKEGRGEQMEERNVGPGPGREEKMQSGGKD